VDNRLATLVEVSKPQSNILKNGVADLSGKNTIVINALAEIRK